MDILEAKPNVVKSDLVEQVYKRVGFTRQEAEEAVDALFNEIKTELASGESVRIAGFASFYLKNKKARKNPPIAPRRDLELEALGQILDSQRFITCHSYIQSEINMLMHVADSMGFRINTFTHIL